MTSKNGIRFVDFDVSLFCILRISETNNKVIKTPKVLVEKQGFSSSDPGAIRTHGQRLKRPLLYQLSYGI